MSSGPADCDLGYTPGHTYDLVVVRPRFRSPAVTAEVQTDGRFSAEVVIPEDLPPGDGWIVVTGSPYDDCGRNGYGSCAGYAAAITIR